MQHRTLERLGLSSDTRAVILHADDVGMCHATIPAAVELFQCRGISSASLMAPCSWARTAAERLLEVGAPDLGAHWTLTSEWSSYRWDALTKQPSLLDDEGQLPHTAAQVAAHAETDAVAEELTAQLDALTGWGLSLSHADSHMGTLMTPRLLPVAISTAVSRGVWPLSLAWDAAQWHNRGLSADQAAQAAAFSQWLADADHPMIDHVFGMPLDHADNHLGIAEHALREVSPGITHFLFHPAIDTPEMRATSPDWPGRVANFEAFRDPRIQQVIEDEGLVVLDYSALHDLLPTGTGADTGVES